MTDRQTDRLKNNTNHITPPWRSKECNGLRGWKMARSCSIYTVYYAVYLLQYRDIFYIHINRTSPGWRRERASSIAVSNTRLLLHLERFRVSTPGGASRRLLNPLMGTLKPQSDGPLYSNTVIGRPTLAVDGWAVTFGRAAAPSKPLFAVPNVIAHASTASVPSYQLHTIRCGIIIAVAL